MDKKDLCEHTRIRLIAAAIGHQQCTATAANIVPLPGTGRFVTIGTPAEVVSLLRKQVPAGEQVKASPSEPGAETTLPEDVAALFGACGFEIRSTDPAEKHPLAVCGSLDAAGLLVETVLTELGQGDPEAVPAEFIALLPGVTYMDPPDGGSVSVLEQFRRMAKDAEYYRLLRDAEKVPGFVWAALEAGEGVDEAMNMFKAIKTPIPFCEPCKAGRFNECEEVFPCTLPASVPAGATDSEGGHHD